MNAQYYFKTKMKYEDDSAIESINQNQNPKQVVNKDQPSPGTTTPMTPDYASAPPAPPASWKRFLPGPFGKIVIAVALITIIGTAISGYVIVLQGKTALGQYLQDELWEAQVENFDNTFADYEGTVTYADSGTFTLDPKGLLSKEDYYDLEEIAEIEKMFKFTLENLQFTASGSAYLNLSDPNHPQTDASLATNLKNQNKDYSLNLDAKLTESELYTKYDYNNSLNGILERQFSNPGAVDTKNKWVRTTDESEIQNIIKTIRDFALINNPYSQSRDTKRMADIRQMMSGLELYYNDQSGYPSSLEELTTGDMRYFGSIPVAPVPPDGTCRDDYNSYSYTPKGAPRQERGYGSSKQVTVYPQYELRFCVGGTVGGVGPGNLLATEGGIQAHPCNSRPECTKQNTVDTEDEPSETKSILKRNRLFNIKSFQGAGTVNGAPTLHYSLELDKEKLKTVINENIDLVLKDSSTNDEYGKFAKEIVELLVNKVSVEHYDIWVGAFDRKVHKTEASFQVMSLTKTAKLLQERYIRGDFSPITDAALGSAKEKSRDAKRVADIRQMQSALELYFNDNNSYPEAKNGTPVGLEEFISAIPEAPMPVDGNCDDYYNTYWYTPKPDGNGSYGSYSYSFCLGGPTGGLAAGITVASERGMESKSGTPPPSSTISPRSKDEVFTAITKAIKQLIQDAPFDARLTIQSSTKRLNKARPIETPKDFIEKEDSYGYRY